MRVGYGWDSHEFKKGLPLKIGGVRLPSDRGLSGHSDGDVLLHALTDALLGAVAAGDIGAFFPPTDKRWKGADSAIFVREAMKHVRHAGYAIANVDSTLILSRPKIGPHAHEIQKHVAKLLGVEPSDVGIKAKTPEGMGTEKAAIAHVTVLLVKSGAKGAEHAKAHAEVPQDDVDHVVKKLLQDVHHPAKAKPKGH